MMTSIPLKEPLEMVLIMEMCQNVSVKTVTDCLRYCGMSTGSFLLPNHNDLVLVLNDRNSSAKLGSFMYQTLQHRHKIALVIHKTAYTFKAQC